MAENVIDILECQMCLEIFNNKYRKPKVLPCQHTFCLSCLKKIARTVPSPDNSSSVSQNVTKIIVKCPECSHEYDAPDGSDDTDFINDTTIVRFLAALPQTSSNDDVYDLKKRLNCLRTKLSDVAEIRAKGISTWEKEVNDARDNIEEMFAEIQSVLDNQKATLLAKLKEFDQTRDVHIHKTMSCAFGLQKQEIVEFCSLTDELLNRKTSQVSESTITENINRCQDLIEQLDEALANNDKDKKWKVTFQAAYQKDAIKTSIENFGNLQLDSPMPLTMDIVSADQATGSETDNLQSTYPTTIISDNVSPGQPMFSESSAKLSCIPQDAMDQPETMTKQYIPKLFALKKTENPWTLKNKTLTEEARLLDLTKSFKSILNKLTPQNFPELMDKTLELPIDNEEKLSAIIDLVFEKAITEPAYSKIYANMCRVLAPLKVPSANGKGNVQFRTILVRRCQRAFESEKAENDAILEMKKTIDAMEDANDQQKENEELFVLQFKARQRFLGNLRFISELYKLKMVTERIMHDYITKLLNSRDDDSLEGAVVLMTTVGKDLDHGPAKKRMDQYFTHISKIIAFLTSTKMSARIRFKLQDVEDLRKRRWVPRKDAIAPKTIAQIHRDAMQDEAQKKIKAQMEFFQRTKTSITSQGPNASLNKADNAWKPGNKDDTKKALTEEEAKTADLTKSFQGILNMLTPQNFLVLIAKTLKLEIDNEERLSAITDMLFETVIRVPASSKVYAKMCRVLAGITVPSANGTGKVQFRTILINRCQRAFVSEKAENDVILEMKKKIDSMEDANAKQRENEKLLMLQVRSKQEALGLMSFMGELYKVRLMTEDTMHGCVQKLLREKDDVSLECLTQLMTKVGKDLDNQKAKNRMDHYFTQISDITRTPARIRFMLQDVEDLRKCHWVPTCPRRAATKTTPTEEETADLKRAFKSILNKLTPQNFQKLMAKTLELPIDNEERLTAIIDLMFEKAIRESAFSQAYANMCRVLSQIKVPSASGTGNVQFRTILINRCQRAFESEKAENDAFIEMRKDIDAMEDAHDKQKENEKLLMLQVKAKQKILGNIRFTGELYKLRMLTENIMHDCILKLLRAKDDDSLEGVAVLMTTVGKDLDHERAKNRMDQYFTHISKIIVNMKTPARIRFMLQDVVDLRKCHWVPRRDDNAPKTIAQIHQDAKQEEAAKKIEALMAIHSHSSKSREGNRSSKGGRPPPQPTSNDDWQTVSVNKGRPQIDCTDNRTDPPECLK